MQQQKQRETTEIKSVVARYLYHFISNIRYLQQRNNTF